MTYDCKDSFIVAELYLLSVLCIKKQPSSYHNVEKDKTNVEELWSVTKIVARFNKNRIPAMHTKSERDCPDGHARAVESNTDSFSFPWLLSS